MKITAQVDSAPGTHEVVLATDGRSHTIVVPPKDTGAGSRANGGELLFLALATCYCNDIYREAAARGIEVEKVHVEVSGEFGGPGDPARNVTYRAKVQARASEGEIRELMLQTDRVAEVQTSLRRGAPVTLASVEAVSSIERP